MGLHSRSVGHLHSISENTVDIEIILVCLTLRIYFGLAGNNCNACPQHTLPHSLVVSQQASEAMSSITRQATSTLFRRLVQPSRAVAVAGENVTKLVACVVGKGAEHLCHGIHPWFSRGRGGG